MIAPYKCHAVWIAYFERQEEEERLYGVKAAVDKVACHKASKRTSVGKRLASWTCPRRMILHTHEEVRRVWTLPSNSKELHQVVELEPCIGVFPKWRKERQSVNAMTSGMVTDCLPVHVYHHISGSVKQGCGRRLSLVL